MSYDPQDTTPEEWHEFHAIADIEKDGLKKSFENSVVGMIDAAIGCFACNTLGHTSSHDPKLDFEYARTKFRMCVEMMEERHDAKNDGQ